MFPLNDGADAITERLTSLLGDLIAIPTIYPPGISAEMARYIADTLMAAGYETAIHSRVNGLDNVVARMGGGSPCLAFNTHIDTVGPGDEALWRHPPLQAHRDGDTITGLGAVNCKGSAAAQIWLAEEIARLGGPARGEVVFTFVTDEESLNRNGMAYLRENGAVKPDMLLLGAPTDLALINAERGVMWIEIETYGQSAHAGEPAAGDNAISRMMRICSVLEAEMEIRLAARTDGNLRSTMNLGMFHGGANTNVVPNRCRVEIDRRLVPAETVEAATAEISDIIAAAGEPQESFKVTLMRGTNGFSGDADAQLMTAMKSGIETVTGTAARIDDAIGVSDGRYFADDDVEIVGFGPGAGDQGHAVNETIEISQLSQSAHILRNAVADVLGVADDS